MKKDEIIEALKAEQHNYNKQYTQNRIDLDFDIILQDPELEKNERDYSLCRFFDKELFGRLLDNNCFSSKRHQQMENILLINRILVSVFNNINLAEYDLTNLYADKAFIMLVHDIWSKISPAYFIKGYSMYDFEEDLEVASSMNSIYYFRY